MNGAGWAGAIASAALWALASCGGGGTATEPEGEASTTGLGSTTAAAESSGAGQSRPPQELVRPEAWTLDEAEDDPFAEHRPSWVQCEIGFGVETGVFEVDTELCTYGAFVQRSLAPIYEGDTLELVLLHDALYAEEPATAHVAVAFGAEIAWETELPIPSEAGQLRPTWTAPADVDVGTPVHLHVHNHGANNYRLVALTVSTP